MKIKRGLLVLGILGFTITSSQASTSVENAVAKFEKERELSCHYERSSRFRFGTVSPQWYKSHYYCMGSNGDYGLTLTVKSTYDGKSSVVKVTYKKIF